MQNDKVATTAVLMFIVNPASIHHSMMYTEALFTTTSWLGLYCLYCQGASLGASLAFAASSAVRSNGEQYITNPVVARCSAASRTLLLKGIMFSPATCNMAWAFSAVLQQWRT
jgi:Gpi18-like mannosyltransferase